MLFAFAAAISVAAVLVICIFIFGNGIPAIAEIGFSNFLFGTTWQPSSDIYGIGVMVLGSFYVMAGALVIGVPLGILCAVFLACFGSDRVSSIAKNGVQLLAGIPSVVYGFLGLVVLVPFIRSNIGGYRPIDFMCFACAWRDDSSNHHHAFRICLEVCSSLLLRRGFGFRGRSRTMCYARCASCCCFRHPCFGDFGDWSSYWRNHGGHHDCWQSGENAQCDYRRCSYYDRQYRS